MAAYFFSQVDGIGVSRTLVLQHPERAWIAAAVFLVGLVMLWRGYRGAPITSAARWVAVFCKAAVWALLALFVLEPMLSREVARKGANEVIILADDSASLGIAENQAGPKRADDLMKALLAGEASGGWIERIATQFRVRQMSFDSRMRGVDSFGAMNFTGQGSRLCGSVRSLLDRGDGSALAAVIVLSDGAATDAAAWATLPAGHAPVFPVLVGARAPEQDVALRDVQVSQSAFEDSPVTLTAKVSARGFDGKEIGIGVLDASGKKMLVEKQRAEAGKPDLIFRLRIAGVKPGVSFFRVLAMDAAALARIENGAWKSSATEATLENNERVIAVDRGSGPYRVLYIGGRPNWEFKFLKRALAADTEVQLPSLIRIAKREPKFEWRGRAGETSNPLFRGFKAEGEEAQRYDQPVLVRLGTRDAKELADGFPKAAEDFFGEYRAIILDDVEAEFFTQEQMNLIERFVSHRGGALLMLGGQECYQAGGYEHTPVGRMLPVYLDRLGSSEPVANGRFNLTREGWLEPWTRLRAQQEEDEVRLATMPGFFVVNQTSSIKPGASILATVSDAEQKPHPALVAQRFGEGRVVALTIGDLWRWGAGDPAQHADLDKAWRQLVRWLVVDVPSRVELDALPNTAEEGQRLRVRARSRDFRAMDDALLKLEVTAPDGKKSEIFTEPDAKEAGAFEAEHFAAAPGGYRAEVEIKDASGAIAGTASAGWAVNPLAEEFPSLEPGRDLMQRMAAETGGQLLALKDLDRLPDLLAKLNVPVKDTLTEPLWHAPWIFALILALLAAEWILRRKGGWI